MPRTLAKDCYLSKQHIATALCHDAAMVKKTARQVLAANLQRLMKKSPELNTQKKIEARTRSLEGKRVAQTTISLMLRPESSTIKANKLDNVERVAHAFGREAWQLLLNEETVGEQMFEMLFGLRPRASGAPQLRWIAGERDEPHIFDADVTGNALQDEHNKAK